MPKRWFGAHTTYEDWSELQWPIPEYPQMATELIFATFDYRTYREVHFISYNGWD